MLVTETAIFRNSYSQRAPLTGCYCILLKRRESEPPVFENIANHSDDVEFRICVQEVKNLMFPVELTVFTRKKTVWFENFRL